MPIIMRIELVLPAPLGLAGRTFARFNRQAEMIDGDLVFVNLSLPRALLLAWILRSSTMRIRMHDVLSAAVEQSGRRTRVISLPLRQN